MRDVAEFCRKMIRPLVTFEFATALVVFTYMKLITAEQFMVVASVSIAYWFATRKNDNDKV